MFLLTLPLHPKLYHRNRLRKEVPAEASVPLDRKVQLLREKEGPVESAEGGAVDSSRPVSRSKNTADKTSSFDRNAPLVDQLNRIDLMGVSRFKEAITLSSQQEAPKYAASAAGGRGHRAAGGVERGEIKVKSKLCG